MIKRQFMVKAGNLVQGQKIAQKWHSLQLAIIQKAAKLKALKKVADKLPTTAAPVAMTLYYGPNDHIIRYRQPVNPHPKPHNKNTITAKRVRYYSLVLVTSHVQNIGILEVDARTGMMVG